MHYTGVAFLQPLAHTQLFDRDLLVAPPLANEIELDMGRLDGPGSREATVQTCHFQIARLRSRDDNLSSLKRLR
jgi:hypothetical protein